MPLAGFISQNGESDQPEGLGRCSFDFALKEARTGFSDAFPQPYPLLKGIIEQNEPRDYISVTSILHCARNEYLKRKVPYYVSPDTLYPAFRGTLFHGLLENNPNPDAITELKTERVHRGFKVVGTFDSLIVAKDAEGRYILQDWKTTENLPKYDSPYSTHVQQVNIYRWLLGLDPDNVTIEVIYFSMSGWKRCRLKDGKQPGRGGKSPVNQIWTDKQVEDFLDARLLPLIASIESDIPMPYSMVADDEKWLCAYCPVRIQCETLAEQENEVRWAKKHGLDPDPNNPATPSAAWNAVEQEARKRLLKKK